LRNVRLACVPVALTGSRSFMSASLPTISVPPFLKLAAAVWPPEPADAEEDVVADAALLEVGEALVAALVAAGATVAAAVPADDEPAVGAAVLVELSFGALLPPQAAKRAAAAAPALVDTISRSIWRRLKDVVSPKELSSP
jgi:hypothetical protein